MSPTSYLVAMVLTDILHTVLVLSVVSIINRYGTVTGVERST